MKFFIDCIPPKSTHQASQRILKRKSDNKMFIGKSESSKGAQVKRDLISLLYPYRPAQAMEGPLQVCIRITWPWRKSEKKKYRERGYRYSDKRPDFDNLAKLICDVMTRIGFYQDDSQIADGRVIKGWGKTPGIGIEIEKLEEAE